MKYRQEGDPLKQRLADVADSFAQVAEAKARAGDDDPESVERGLQESIDRAREAGVTWGAIGDVLGLTRGNAYQRYRQRSGPA